MSEARRNELERLDELLADRALFGLDAAEEAEMRKLLQAHPERDGEADTQALDRAAAAMTLALKPAESVQLSNELRGQLAAGAKAFFANVPEEREAPRLRALPAPRRANAVAWWIAAAAAVLALLAWWPRGQRDGAPTRAELVARADTLRVDAKGTELAKDAVGDVVWSNAAQRGFVRVHGLPANDPTKSQYQLWIFDADQEHPIDGGVFDAPASGELELAIDAKLRVGKPTLFAITIEKPGGVVVSDRQRIALVAPLQ